MGLTDVFTKPLNRAGAAAQNALEVARFGGLETGEEGSPYEVVAHRPVYRLRRYFPDAQGDAGAPVLLVPPMMLAAEVYDVSPSSTGVTSSASRWPRVSTARWILEPVRFLGPS